jgi:hypothetical protein
MTSAGRFSPLGLRGIFFLAQNLVGVFDVENQFSAPLGANIFIVDFYNHPTFFKVFEVTLHHRSHRCDEIAKVVRHGYSRLPPFIYILNLARFSISNDICCSGRLAQEVRSVLVSRHALPPNWSDRV